MNFRTYISFIGEFPIPPEASADGCDPNCDFAPNCVGGISKAHAKHDGPVIISVDFRLEIVIAVAHAGIGSALARAKATRNPTNDWLGVDRVSLLQEGLVIFKCICAGLCSKGQRK